MNHCLPGMAAGVSRGVRYVGERRSELRMCTTATVVRQVPVLLCLLVVGAASVAGQANTGTLEGVVRDESGGVLPGATVAATHAESTDSRSNG